MTTTWETLDGRPGFQGKKRNALIKGLDKEFGKGNWRFAWEVFGMGETHFLPFEKAILLYEDAYFMFIQTEEVRAEDIDGSAIRKALVDGGPSAMAMDIAEYQEVYDNNRSNVKSGLDYNKQETTSNHYQDISIRRVLARLGLRFKGRKDELLHVRSSSKQKLGKMLSPGKVPFHFIHLVKQPNLKGWWKPFSLEDFWQSNKVIQVKE